MNLSIIIPTYNRVEVLQETFQALIKAIENMNVEVIIVNDNKNNLLNPADYKHPKVKFVDNPKQGAASARNYGASLTSRELLLFLDDDIIVNKTSIETSISLLLSINKSVVNCNWEYEPSYRNQLRSKQFGRYLEYINYTTLKGWCDPKLKWVDNGYINTSSTFSAFLMIKKIDFDLIKGYDENIPLAGYEDNDLGLKLMNHEFKILINTKSVIIHNEIDRNTLSEYLERKMLYGINKFKAFQIGHQSAYIHYTPIKKIYYHILLKLEMPIYLLTKLLPNNKVFDKLYFLLVNRLVGINIFKGFSLNQDK